MTTADIHSIADRIDQWLRSINGHEAAIRADLRREQQGNTLPNLDLVHKKPPYGCC